jgi:hypothetical protein
MRDALVGFFRSLGYNARGFASAEDFLACSDLERYALACVVKQQSNARDR